MTAVRSPVTARRAIPATTVAALGCATLTARPAVVGTAPDATTTLLAIFLLLAAVGLALPLPPERATHRRSSPWVPLAVGVGAFCIGRILSGGLAPGPVTATALLLNSVAAVSEEIWFRRFVFGWLAPAGRPVAIVGSAALFAAVHVTTYGAWVLPLDLAAGLVLGWQRDATGSWHVPAVTHVLANVLAVL